MEKPTKKKRTKKMESFNFVLPSSIFPSAMPTISSIPTLLSTSSFIPLISKSTKKVGRIVITPSPKKKNKIETTKKSINWSMD